MATSGVVASGMPPTGYVVPPAPKQGIQDLRRDHSGGSGALVIMVSMGMFLPL